MLVVLAQRPEENRRLCVVRGLGPCALPTGDDHGVAVGWPIPTQLHTAPDQRGPQLRHILNDNARADMTGDCQGARDGEGGIVWLLWRRSKAFDTMRVQLWWMTTHPG